MSFLALQGRVDPAFSAWDIEGCSYYMMSYSAATGPWWNERNALSNFRLAVDGNPGRWLDTEPATLFGQPPYSSKDGVPTRTASQLIGDFWLWPDLPNRASWFTIVLCGDGWHTIYWWVMDPSGTPSATPAQLRVYSVSRTVPAIGGFTVPDKAVGPRTGTYRVGFTLAEPLRDGYYPQTDIPKSQKTKVVGSHVEYRLDGIGDWLTVPAANISGTSGFVDLSGTLSTGAHRLQVRPVTDAAITGATSVSPDWKADFTPPAPPGGFTGPPFSRYTASADATVEADLSEAGGTAECRLDGGAWQACSSRSDLHVTFALKSLSAGRHSVSVRQTDDAGNVGAAATKMWTIDNRAVQLPVPLAARPSLSLDPVPSCTSYFHTSVSQGNAVFCSQWSSRVSGCSVTAADGRGQCWGRNELGSGIDNAPYFGLGRSLEQVSVSGGTACAVLADGAVGCWGASAGLNKVWTSNQRAVGVAVGGYAAGYFQSAYRNLLNPFDITYEASTGPYVCAWYADGRMNCWGTAAGSSASAPTVPDFGARKVVSASIGAEGSVVCALLDDGSIQCFPFYDPKWYSVSMPVKFSGTPAYPSTFGSSKVSMVSVGGACSGDNDWNATTTCFNGCVILTDGSVNCWGSDESWVEATAQFGSRKAIWISSSPASVWWAWNSANWVTRTPDARVRPRTCVVLDDGSVSCWGAGATEPVPDFGGRKALQVSVGVGNICALLQGGYVKCWNSSSTPPSDSGWRVN